MEWAPFLELELAPGSKGRFEVTIDGELVFSKAELHRFPHEGEIVGLLRPRLGPRADWR